MFVGEVRSQWILLDGGVFWLWVIVFFNIEVEVCVFGIKVQVVKCVKEISSDFGDKFSVFKVLLGIYDFMLELLDMQIIGNEDVFL